MLSAVRPEVLLADIGLPGMSGFELIREARRLAPELAIALMTADASVDVAVQALRSDVDDFLPKPITRWTSSSRSTGWCSGPGPDPATCPSVSWPSVRTPTTSRSVSGGTSSAIDGPRPSTMNHGSRGGDAGRRAEEAEKAASLLGSADLILGDLDDTRIPEGGPTVGLIELAIESVGPSIVYTHTLYDLHQDHRNVNRATMVAARQVSSVYCYRRARRRR